MAKYNSDWEELGRNIQDIVDKAVNSQDYQKLNQTIRQTVNRAVDVGSDALRKAVDVGGDALRKAADAASRPAEKPQILEQPDVEQFYGSTSNLTIKGVLKLIGGSLTLGLFVATLAPSIVFTNMVATVCSLAGITGGGLLLGSGVGNLNRVTRFKSYRRTLGQKTYCSIEKLAKGAGKNVKFVRKDLVKIIDSGLLPEGHLDQEETMLITSHATYHYFEQSRQQLEQQQQQKQRQEQLRQSTHTPQVQEVLDKGDAFLKEIRYCNDLIPGEEISRKIYRMETIVERIFQRADARPEIIPDLKKLMDYYLPMTVKLLHAYADMDSQPAQGQTILASKREIEETLDTLNLAFEKLLDDLFEDTAMDVSSDISVLQTLLAQEGLTEDDFSQMKKQRNL